MESQKAIKPVKGFTQRDLVGYMKRKGLFDVWRSRGMSNFEAVRLIMKDRLLPETIPRKEINAFLSFVLNK